MNYPLAEAVISFVGGEQLDRRIVGQHFELAANIRTDDGPTFAAPPRARDQPSTTRPSRPSS